MKRKLLWRMAIMGKRRDLHLAYQRRSSASWKTPADCRPLGQVGESSGLVRILTVVRPTLLQCVPGGERELMRGSRGRKPGCERPRASTAGKRQPVAGFEIRRSLRSVLVRRHADARGSARGKAHRQWTISISRADVVLLSLFAYHLDVDLAPSPVRILPRIVAQGIQTCQVVTNGRKGLLLLAPVLGEVDLPSGRCRHALKNCGGHGIELRLSGADHVDDDSRRLCQFRHILGRNHTRVIRAVRENYDYLSSLILRSFFHGQ